GPTATAPFRVRVQRKDGSWCSLQASSHRLPEASGSRRLVLRARDVSDRRLLEEQSFHLHKQKAAGRLAGCIAREFENLLTVILCASGDALGRLTQALPFWDHLQRIRLSAERASRLTHHMQSFSRWQPLQPQASDVAEVISRLHTL